MYIYTSCIIDTGLVLDVMVICCIIALLGQGGGGGGLGNNRFQFPVSQPGGGLGVGLRGNGQ